jgi:hypothetical protein
MMGDLSANAQLALFVFGAGVFVGLLPGFSIAWFLIRCAEKRTNKLLSTSQLYAKQPPTDYDSFQIPGTYSERQPDGCGF